MNIIRESCGNEVIKRVMTFVKSVYSSLDKHVVSPRDYLRVAAWQRHTVQRCVDQLAGEGAAFIDVKCGATVLLWGSGLTNHSYWDRPQELLSAFRGPLCLPPLHDLRTWLTWFGCGRLPTPDSFVACADWTGYLLDLSDEVCQVLQTAERLGERVRVFNVSVFA